jgi:hypothetical protein
MEYSFARSSHRLEAPDFDPSYKKASHKGVRMAQIAKHLRFLTWIAKALLCLPESLAEKLGSGFHMFLLERRVGLSANSTSYQIHYPLSKVAHELMYHDCVQRLFGEIESLKRESAASGPDSAHVTVFRELLGSKLPNSEKEPHRLAADAQVLVSAGSETTARALTFATYSLLTLPDVLTALKQELEAAIPSTDPAERILLAQVQHLPYLSGVIKESLRLSYGVVGRLARIWPNEVMQFHEWTIPAGTAVSMTSYDVHRDEAIFPHSFAFKPERWVGNPGLERYLVSFGKGTRQCLGMNLAYAEIYLTLARLFRWFGSGSVRSDGDVGVLELFETDESDVKLVAEVLVPFVKKRSAGVRAVISP